jgi:hypothetical protein
MLQYTQILFLHDRIRKQAKLILIVSYNSSSLMVEIIVLIPSVHFNAFKVADFT